MEKIQGIFKKIATSAAFVHIGFCLAAFALFYFAIHFYIGDMRSNEAQLGYVACIYFIVCVYTGRWLSQTWLLKNKPGLFLLFALLSCIILIVVGGLFVQFRFQLHNKTFTDFLFKISPFFIISLVIGVFTKLARAALQKQVQDAKATSEQKQSELNLLQSQLSPHFLFNTLNNMYGISIEQHERIPNLLLKLSDLLRYSVYNTKQLYVPLKDELEYIRNYIDFEKIRIGERLVLNTNIEDIKDSRIKIAPMLMIVFIENAFKHSKNTAEQEIAISIELKIWNTFILLSVKNSKNSLASENSSIKESSGFGLDNVIKRLDLLYGKEYILEQYAERDMYTVNLRVKIKN